MILSCNCKGHTYVLLLLSLNRLFVIYWGNRLNSCDFNSLTIVFNFFKF